VGNSGTGTEDSAKIRTCTCYDAGADRADKI